MEAIVKTPAPLPYAYALNMAEWTKEQLATCCDKIEIAGSIRRKKRECKDIEIVAIAKPWQTGLFLDGIALAVNDWEKVKGDLAESSFVRYTQRILPEGSTLDLFLCTPINFGYIFALRTGSAEFNTRVLFPHAKRKGFSFENGEVWHRGRVIAVPTELQFFELIGLPFVNPQDRR